jgi:hypothetical protein
MSTLAAHPLLLSYAATLILWLMYIHVMAALRVWNDLHWLIRAHLLLIAPVFITLDVAVNITIGSLLFLELPRWWTLSERLHYHATRDHGWRTAMSSWMCRNMLNPFDPDGHHCGRK